MVTSGFDDEQISVTHKEHAELQADTGLIEAAAQLAELQTDVNMGVPKCRRQAPENKEHFSLLVGGEPGQREADVFFGCDA